MTAGCSRLDNLLNQGTFSWRSGSLSYRARWCRPTVSHGVVVVELRRPCSLRCRFGAGLETIGEREPAR